jgi:hypothetical protein
LQERVCRDHIPITLRQWHRRKASQRLAKSDEDRVEKVKAIVINLFTRGIRDVLLNEMVSEVITDVGFVSIPQHLRLGREAVQKDGGKEGAKLMSNLYFSSFMKTLMPFSIILQETSG